MDAGVFHLDVVFELQEELLDSVQGNIRVEVEFILADTVVLQIDHTAPQGGRKIDAQERRVIEKGDVIVDFIAVTKNPDAGKPLLPMQDLAAEAIDHHPHGIGDLGQGGDAPFRTEVDVLEITGDMEHPAERSEGEGDRTVGGPARLHQAKPEAQPALVQVALETVQGSDGAKRGRVFKHLDQPRQLGGKLGFRTLSVHLGQNALPQVFIE